MKACKVFLTLCHWGLSGFQQLGFLPMCLVFPKGRNLFFRSQDMAE